MSPVGVSWCEGCSCRIQDFVGRRDCIGQFPERHCAASMMCCLVSLAYGVVVGRDVSFIEQVVERFFVCWSKEPNKGCNLVLLHASEELDTCFRHKRVERQIRRLLGSLLRDAIQRPLNFAA